jgi:hypothetical protein
MLDIYQRRVAATLGGQRRGDSPTQPAIFALGQIIGLANRATTSFTLVGTSADFTPSVVQLAS